MKIESKKLIVQVFVVLMALVLTSTVGAAAGISPSGAIDSSVDPTETASRPFEQFSTSQSVLPQLVLPPSFGVEFRLTNPNSSTIEFIVDMNMTFNRIVGGSISGTICDSPNWVLTNGIITPTRLVYVATHTGSGCANNVLVNTYRSGPTTFSGTYTWNYDTTSPTVYDADLQFVGRTY